LEFGQVKEFARLKAHVQQQDEWLDKYWKHITDNHTLMNEMKSVLEKAGLW
jgi:hypothetical protein